MGGKVGPMWAGCGVEHTGLGTGTRQADGQLGGGWLLVAGRVDGREGLDGHLPTGMHAWGELNWRAQLRQHATCAHPTNACSAYPKPCPAAVWLAAPRVPAAELCLTVLPHPPCLRCLPQDGIIVSPEELTL